jgi:hypothetical protein
MMTIGDMSDVVYNAASGGSSPGNGGTGAGDPTGGDGFDKPGSGGEGAGKVLKAGDKTPNGHSLTSHAADNANARGFTGQRIDNTINNYSQKVYQYGGQTVYAKKNGNWYDVVITNRDGDIVTVVGGQSNSMKTWKDVEKMLNNNGGYSTLPLD